MSKKKAMAIASIAIVGLAVALLCAASMTNLLLVGDYYVTMSKFEFVSSHETYPMIAT